MAVTAKVRCFARELTGGNPDGDEYRVQFTANYTDAAGERVNTEWAKYTPGFQLTMFVLDSVPFEVGKNYTLTFDED